ncbi:MAG: SGNH/GDSL hydrolase family protein [Hyphomicrobiaceae bacterium]|nr:MAG: SGNH/GDSL hydrolase family protein [Hyphomicrobiaceae bacterium]
MPGLSLGLGLGLSNFITLEEDGDYGMSGSKRKVITIGDSIMAANCTITSAGGNTITPTHAGMRGLINWFQALNGFPLGFRFENYDDTQIGGDNFAVAGDSFANVRTRITGALNINGNILWANIGTNDANANATAQSIIAGWRWTIEKTIESGKVAWMNTIFPRNNDAGQDFTTAQNNVRLEANAALRAMESEYKGQLIVFDGDICFLDTATGKAKSEYFGDGLHPNALGAATFAEQVMGPKLAKYYGSMKIKRSVPSEFNAVSAPLGNLVTNSDFTGTGGTVTGTNLSGVMPDSWAGGRTDGSHVTCVYSIESKTSLNGDAKNFVKMALSSAGAGVDNETPRISPSATITTNVVAGQLYVAECEVIVPVASSGANILRSLYVEGRDNGVNGPIARFFDVGYTFPVGGAKEYFPNDKERQIPLRSHPFRANTTTGIMLRINADVDGTLTGARDVYIGKPVIRPVEMHGDLNTAPQYVVATAGSTIYARGDRNLKLLLKPAATLATLTVVMNPLPRNGDVFTLSSTQAVTALTLTSAKTVNGAITAVTANTPVSYQYNETADQWFKI